MSLERETACMHLLISEQRWMHVSEIVNLLEPNIGAFKQGWYHGEVQSALDNLVRQGHIKYRWRDQGLHVREYHAVVTQQPNTSP